MPRAKKTVKKEEDVIQAESKKYKICKLFSYIFVRSGPSNDYPIIGQVESDTVDGYEVKDGFIRIGEDQWVLAAYLREV